MSEPYMGPQVGDIREYDGKRYEVKEVKWDLTNPFDLKCSLRLWPLDPELINIEFVKIMPR